MSTDEKNPSDHSSDTGAVESSVDRDGINEAAAQEEAARGGDAGSGPGNGDRLVPMSMTARRLERERRRAVRAESRLAEIELALRREIDRGNGGGVSARTMRQLLNAVQTRVASLEDEVRASEQELLDLSATQRKIRGELRADDDDLAFGLEQARRELRDAVTRDRVGLPELTRQRVEFEVELDRLQSLLTYRDNVCDGLAEELEQGTRVAAEVTARLADLSRGRVAPARRPATQDARVATLRRNLESEQAQLHQARRALEAARAELKVAQRGVSDVEQRTGDQIGSLKAQVGELQSERENLQTELERAKALTEDDRNRFQRELEEERTAHMQLRERADELETRFNDLQSQLTMSGDDRQQGLRLRIEQREEELRQTEAERVRLAEKVSLLQAALASKESQLRKADLSAVRSGDKPKGKVVSMMQDRLADSGASETTSAPTTDEILRQRETEIDRLSERWKELQGAYREAVAEFDDVREKRDRLRRNLDRTSNGGENEDLEITERSSPSGSSTPQRDQGSQVSTESSEGAGSADKDIPLVLRLEGEEAEPAAEDDPVEESTSAVSSSSDSDEASSDPVAKELPTDGDLEVQEGVSEPTIIFQVDEDRSRCDAVAGLAKGRGVSHSTDANVGVGASTKLLAVVNLLSKGKDPLGTLSTVAGKGRVVRMLAYGAVEGRGAVCGTCDVFPTPFDPDACAAHLLAFRPRIRRTLTVGEFVEPMGRLRETLGKANCSTAVAFDEKQAMDLIPLVRPEYVLIDLAMPKASGIGLFMNLSREMKGLRFGVTWSKPLVPDALRSAVRAAQPLEPFSEEDLVAASAMLFDRHTAD